MMTKTERWSTPASGSSDGTSRPLGKAAVDAAKRVCMIRGPRRAWLVGLGLGLGSWELLRGITPAHAADLKVGPYARLRILHSSSIPPRRRC